MNKRTNLVFSTLQGIAVLIAIIGTFAALFLGGWGVSAFHFYLDIQKYGYFFYAIIGLATIATVSLCSYVALYQFFALCQRLKHGTAFTPINEKAMHRIALCCSMSGAMLIVALILSFVFGSGFFLFFVELLALLAVAYLCVGLVAYALELLLRRATAIQQENDLTI